MSTEKRINLRALENRDTFAEGILSDIPEPTGCQRFSPDYLQKLCEESDTMVDIADTMLEAADRMGPLKIVNVRETLERLLK